MVHRQKPLEPNEEFCGKVWLGQPYFENALLNLKQSWKRYRYAFLLFQPRTHRWMLPAILRMTENAGVQEKHACLH
ncbi:hypothetical protein USDA257_c47960 [Sinorhizobium fredii USDA 257]|uniref:Uncharacterized protein n=1 Tax=Sinorhizobium fredii (strain USDA 257) TaxID=1185652 RepID=I3XBS5_SINF2|nr:hypothetical protein USDA257_c47960 [Sinorhizobium fredii USDA 257]